jgi:hypothetical protein
MNTQLMALQNTPSYRKAYFGGQSVIPFFGQSWNINVERVSTTAKKKQPASVHKSGIPLRS